MQRSLPFPSGMFPHCSIFFRFVLLLLIRVADNSFFCAVQLLGKLEATESDVLLWWTYSCSGHSRTDSHRETPTNYADVQTRVCASDNTIYVWQAKCLAGRMCDKSQEVGCALLAAVYITNKQEVKGRSFSLRKNTQTHAYRMSANLVI